MADKKLNEKDLDDLLDNALQDFGKTAPQSAPADGTNTGDITSATADSGVDAEDAFFMEQAKALAERMSTLFGGPDTPSGDVPPLPQNPDQIMAGFQKMAEAAAMTLQGENPANDDDVAKYSDSIAQALKGLQEGSDNLTAPVSEADVASMFGSLNLGGDGEGGDANAFLPFMEGMMQSLLSAEVLLPSIKEFLSLYPKFFSENDDKISPEDKERYEKQMELYKVIERHLESENANDSTSVKREKFRVVLEDMRKLQEYGQPPEQVLAETGGDLQMIDPNLAAGANGPQCPTM